jgi:transcription elongation factor GreB
VSKAFTRESDDAIEDQISPAQLQRQTGAPTYITRQGADRLSSQLHDLLERRRALDKDADGVTAKRSDPWRRLDAEIQKLQSRLNSAIVADPPGSQEKVAFGSFVRIRDDTGEEETYQIVGVAEADPGENRISSASPLGRALLSHRAGEKLTFQSPAGSRELTILKVEQ